MVAGREDLGRVNLIFRDDDRELCLLVELKLGSAYGDRQLERYLDALDALPARRKALIAVTATSPLAGEDEVASDDHWLGSLRFGPPFTTSFMRCHIPTR